MIPGLILHGTMPRRFFVPLEWSQGTRIEKLHRIMKKNGRGALYWLGAKGEVKSCEVGLDDCLPRDLWKDHLTL